MDTAPICGNCFVKSFSENIAVEAIDSGMKVTQTTLPGVLLLEPSVFTDSRGFFLESYNKQTMAKLGIVDEFVQDNHSFSLRNVLRGLHYQIRHAQGKLVRVVSGEIFDVAGLPILLASLFSPLVSVISPASGPVYDERLRQWWNITSTAERNLVGRIND